MAKVTFGRSVLQVEGLEVKYDVVPVSSSLALIIGDKDSASIVQQLYYWLEQGYGEVIDGVRWIYKSVKEWIEEVFPTYTSYQLGKMMKQLSDRGIIRREKLFTKHQIQNGARFWWQPKNQTYYYSLNTDKLQELADNYKTPKTPENSVFVKTQILSNEEIKDTKDFDCAKNNTDITSIKNNSRDQSHPHLPCEGEEKRTSHQEKQELSNRLLDNQEEVNSVNPKAVEKDTNVGCVEQNINQNNCTDESLIQQDTKQVQKSERPSPKLKVTKTKQKRENKAPWQDETEKSQFYRALIQALPIVANSHSPQGLAKTIIAQLKRGEEHTYWDDFAAGLPIGTSTKPEWEIEPGVPYPMFIEYLTEKIIKGNNTQTTEQARNEVFRILSQPRQATAFWGQFKRSVVNVSEQVERDRALGVSNPNTPVWTRERIEPSVEEAAEAGQKIMALNGDVQAVIEASKSSPSLPVSQSSSSPDPWTEDDRPSTNSDLKPQPQAFEEDTPQPTMREMLEARGVKGFCPKGRREASALAYRDPCKQMPKVSREEAEAEAKAESEALKRQQMNYKTHLNQMSVDEINELLKDPISRTELTPQLIDSNYELITDYLGQIIGVKLSDLQIREARARAAEREWT